MLAHTSGAEDNYTCGMYLFRTATSPSCQISCRTTTALLSTKPRHGTTTSMVLNIHHCTVHHQHPHQADAITPITQAERNCAHTPLCTRHPLTKQTLPVLRKGTGRRCQTLDPTTNPALLLSRIPPFSLPQQNKTNALPTHTCAYACPCWASYA